MTHSIMAFSIITFSIMILNIMTLNKMTLIIMTHRIRTVCIRIRNETLSITTISVIIMENRCSSGVKRDNIKNPGSHPGYAECRGVDAPVKAASVNVTLNDRAYPRFKLAQSLQEN
jgi:hypothetical protein